MIKKIRRRRRQRLVEPVSVLEDLCPSQEKRRDEGGLDLWASTVDNTGSFAGANAYGGPKASDPAATARAL